MFSLILSHLFLSLVSSQNVEVWMSDPTRNVWLTQQPSVQFTTDTSNISYTITVDENAKYQTMDGFGASLTDASCWLLKYRISNNHRDSFLKMLFSADGINLSILRQPIGASDFNWEAWTYDDSDTDDMTLSKFALWREDDYIRPMLDLAINVNPGRIKLFGSPWSPPAWMRTNKHLFGGGGTLRTACYDAYATYFLKFVQEYEKKGTPVYAITVQNEPLYAPQNYPGMLMSDMEQIIFIRDYLGPKFQLGGIKTKIIAFDHNYDQQGFQYARNVLQNAGASRFIDGTGFHTYTYLNHPAMTDLHNLFPTKNVWITEAGTGLWVGNYNEQFADQMMHLIRSPRNWAKGVVFWNVALDQNSAPKLAYVDQSNSNRGLVTIRSDATDMYSFESGYYSMGHSSKFVHPNAYRVESNTFQDDVETVAYMNADDSIVLVISNRTPNLRQLKIKWANRAFQYQMPGNAALTFKWNRI